jgi:hypothetical protein
MWKRMLLSRCMGWSIFMQQMVTERRKKGSKPGFVEVSLLLCGMLG